MNKRYGKKNSESGWKNMREQEKFRLLSNLHSFHPITENGLKIGNPVQTAISISANSQGPATMFAVGVACFRSASNAVRD